MKKFQEIKKYVVLQKKLGLYVAESHYFDAKGKRQLTLTDKYDFAEQMTLPEVTDFMNVENKNNIYEIYEVSETEEEVDEYEED